MQREIEMERESIRGKEKRNGKRKIKINREKKNFKKEKEIT